MNHDCLAHFKQEAENSDNGQLYFDLNLDKHTLRDASVKNLKTYKIITTASCFLEFSSYLCVR